MVFSDASEDVKINLTLCEENIEKKVLILNDFMVYFIVYIYLLNLQIYSKTLLIVNYLYCLFDVNLIIDTVIHMESNKLKQVLHMLQSRFKKNDDLN